MPALFKEPLLYFLLLGGAFFLLFVQVSDQGLIDTPQAEEIVVSNAQINTILLAFEKNWQRYPTQEELGNLLEEYIREEIYYREALAMELDKNDSIIRRRLRQKIEFLAEDITPLRVPQEEELQVFLDAHSTDYLPQVHFSFTQIYFDVSRRGNDAATDAQALLKALQDKHQDGEGDVSQLGDPLMMVQPAYINITETDIKRLLGDKFFAAIGQAPVGIWLGPLESGFGLHLVYIQQREAARAPLLKDVYEEIVKDWSLAERKELNDDFYTSLRQRYTVTIEDSTPSSAQSVDSK